MQKKNNTGGEKMKKLKSTSLIILSILIFGIIIFIPNITNAYEHKPNNVLDNVFIQDGEAILPFIFENSNQTISKAYVKEQFEKYGLTIKNQDTLGNILKTGDKIIASNTITYSVLIYGDIDANGTVNVFDAQKALQHYLCKGEYDLTGIYALAANVYNENNIVDSFDAQRILKFWVGSETNLVAHEPEPDNSKKIESIIVHSKVDDCYRYDKKKIATIKSSNNISLTNDCNIELALNGPTGSSNVEVGGSFSNTAGLYDIYLNPTKSGQYTITPIISGLKVKKGIVKGPEIKITVNENYELTDILVDGNVLPEVVDENSDSVIDVQTSKYTRPNLEFYHIYRDSKENELARFKITDEAILKRYYITLTAEAKGKINQNPAVCNGERLITWNETSKTNNYIPNKILIEGEEEGTENIAINVEYGNTNISKIIKVAVKPLRIQDIIIDESKSIDLYSYSPDYNHKEVGDITKYDYDYLEVSKNGKTYTVVKGSDGKPYTILPITLKDEYGTEVRIKANKVQENPFHNISGFVTFLENAQESSNFVIKKFCLVNGEYYAECSGNQVIDAVGIALKDTNSTVSNIEIHYDTLSGRSHTDISANVMKDSIVDITTQGTDTLQIDRYNNSRISTIKLDTSLSLINNATNYQISTQIINQPEGSEESYAEAVLAQEDNGLYNITLYATKAGEYTVKPVVSGVDVKNGVIEGSEINVTVNENYQVTDIEVNGNMLTTENLAKTAKATNTQAEADITVKTSKYVRPEIKFYHIYKDDEGNELAKEVIPEAEMLKAHITLTAEGKGSINQNPTICNDKRPISWNDANQTNDYVPNSILIEGEKEGTENITITIEQEENASVSKIIRVNVEKLQIQDIIVDNEEPIDLYSYSPIYSQKKISTSTTYHYFEGITDSGKTYTVVKGSDGKPYTILPITLKDEYGAEVKIKANKVHKNTFYNIPGFVTLLENAQESNNFIIKKFCLVNGEYYSECSGEQVIDAIGIALKDTNSTVSNIEIYHDMLLERTHTDISVNIKATENTKSESNMKKSINTNAITNAINTTEVGYPEDNSITNTMDSSTSNNTINSNIIDSDSIDSNSLDDNTINNNTIKNSLD